MSDERPAADTPDDAASPPLPEPLPPHKPLDVRSLALVVLALLASVYVLHWARDVFIPLMFGLLFTYALSPVVNLLQRLHIARSLAAAMVILTLLAGVGWLIYTLSDDAVALVESLPSAAQKLRLSMQAKRGSGEGTIEKMQKAAKQLEQAANEGSTPSPPSKGVTRVQIERPRFNLGEFLWTGTLGVFGLVGQITVVAFLTFFMLIGRDSFRRKMVKVAGPTFGEKRITVQALDEITQHIERYLLVQLFMCVLVGVTTWLAFMWIGMSQAAAWGVIAGVLTFIPYLGAIVVSIAAPLMAFVQFGTIELALVVGGASVVIHVIAGNLLIPLLTGRVARMSPLVVFAAVLIWAWLWGVWGMLLGVPILMVVKVVCDRVDGLKRIGELLGD